MWLYEERNYCIPKTFHTIVTDVEKYELIEKFAIVNQAVENKVPPEKTKMKRCCNYCSYYNLCKKYKSQANMSFIIDTKGLLNKKDSPIDKGVKVWEQLYEDRIKV